MALVETSIASYEPTVRVVEVFREAEFRYTGGRYDNHLFRYRLLVPEHLDRSKRYPILLWLHGSKERGGENRAQLRWLDLVLEDKPPKQFDYFVLAVQCPPDVHKWSNEFAKNDGSGAADDMLAVAMAALKETIANWPIDGDRIYLAGVSSGGNGCWEMAMRYPDRFAAVVPMASSGGDPLRLERIRNVPVWAFHALKDRAPRPNLVQATVDELNALGGRAQLTLVQNQLHGAMDALQRHDCWTSAIRHFEVMDWLFQQRRGAWFAPAPERRAWEWLNYSAVPLGFALICTLAWLAERRRRLGLRTANQVAESLP